MQYMKVDKLLTYRMAGQSRSASMTGIWIILVVLLLAGCADSSISDLQNYVSDVKSRKGTIEPVPEFRK
jgi:hypothetical protein